MIPKYRAWDKANKKLCDVKTWSEFNGGEVTIKRDGENASYVVSLDDIVIMQSTGLFDKNGTEIFEGDIVKSCGYDSDQGRIYKTTDFTGVIVYRKNSFCLQFGDFLDSWWANDEEVEVIGNIYENPELLERVEE